MPIISPIATGNGAYILHRILEDCLTDYHVISYHPRLTLCPFVLPYVVNLDRASIVHVPADFACFFSHRKIPVVMTFHNYVLDRWMRPYSSALQQVYYQLVLRACIKRALQKVSAVTAVSHFTAELVEKDLHLPRPIRVIYNGVDTRLFRPLAAARPRSDTINVLFSGNLTRRKGAQWLPAIAEQLDKNIVIHYTAGLRTRKILPPLPNLRSVGTVPFRNMPDLYRQMDILLMPTVREGFGLSVAEAMACGLAVVASDCSALPELIDKGEGGFLCPVSDVAAFSEKLNFLASSPGQRRAMGQYNRAKVEKHFTIERMANQYRELFESINQRH